VDLGGEEKVSLDLSLPEAAAVAEDSLTLDEPEPEVAAAPLFEPRGAVSWTIPSD
jgi:hypothetical protein